jgi:hypothetical protein
VGFLKEEAMNDDILSRLREEPRAEFRDTLRRRLRSLDAETNAPRRRRVWLMRAAAAACTASLVGALLAIPSARAVAREFLALFRVQRFAAVPVLPERIAQLQNGEIDLKSILAENVEVLIEPDPPHSVADLSEASSFVGFPIRTPEELPDGYRLADISVHGLGKARLYVDLARLQSLLDVLGIDDASLPPELDGAIVEVTTPAHAALRYRKGRQEIRLIVSESPEVVYPADLDVAALGETALLASGLDREEARMLARTIDWRSTLVFPIPVGRASYREIELPNGRGLLLTCQRTQRGRSKDGSGWRSILFLVRDERIYALEGPGSGLILARMAESIG